MVRRRALLTLAVAVALLWWLTFRFGVDIGRDLGRLLLG